MLDIDIPRNDTCTRVKYDMSVFGPFLLWPVGGGRWTEVQRERIQQEGGQGLRCPGCPGEALPRRLRPLLLPGPQQEEEGHLH